jgi:CcmD family protein
MLSLYYAPIETTQYMIAGYAVIFSVMFVYLISLAVRYHKLEQEVQSLLELDDTIADNSSQTTSTNG